MLDLDVSFLNLMQTIFMGIAVVAGVFFLTRYLQKGDKASSREDIEELRQ